MNGRTVRNPLRGTAFDEARSDTSLRRRIGWSLAGIVLFFVAWELAAWYMRLTSPRAERIFPSMLLVVTASFRALGVFSPGSVESYRSALQVLARHSAVTGLRVVVGTVVGATTGILIGLVMAYSHGARRALNPTIQVMRTIPLLALIPLFVVWFGGREIGMYLYVAFAVFVMVVIGTFHAAVNVPSVQGRYARTLGASRPRMFATVVLPGMGPELYGTIRVVAALSWSFALGAEFTGAQSGLGYLLIASQRFGFIGRVVVVTAVFTAYAVAIDWLLKVGRDRLMRWQG